MVLPVFTIKLLEEKCVFQANQDGEEPQNAGALHGFRAQSTNSERQELDQKASDPNLIVRVMSCGEGGISSC